MTIQYIEKFQKAVHTHRMDLRLQKRLNWIMRCASLASGYLHHFDYLKGNVSRYFFESTAIHVPFRMQNYWITITQTLTRHTCYYLGTYPNYWSPANKRIVYAGDLWTPYDFPMANEPLILRFTDQPISPEQLLEMLTKGESQEEFISSDEKKEWTSLEETFGKGNLINYLYPERMSKEAREAFMAGYPSPYYEIDKAITDMAFFKKKLDIIEWLRQKYILDERKLRYLKCIQVKYPKASKEPQYKIETPQLPADWPGIPTSEMQLPQPSYQKPKGLDRVITLRIIFNIIHIGPNNGYYLVLYVGEEVIK